MKKKSIRGFGRKEIMKEKSKTQGVLNYLKAYGSISHKEAVEHFHLYRLGSVIFELRKRGYDIITENVEFKSEYGIKGNYAVYHLIGE